MRNKERVRRVKYGSVKRGDGVEARLLIFFRGRDRGGGRSGGSSSVSGGLVLWKRRREERRQMLLLVVEALHHISTAFPFLSVALYSFRT